MLAYKEGFTELLLEGEAGKWYFKYGNGYIYAKSTTSTVLSFDTNKKKSANISISNGNASIGFDIVANSKYLSYSTKTSNFGYYNSIFGDHGVPVQIYKKQRRANGLSISTKSFTTTTADLEGNFHSYVTLTNPNNLSPITYIRVQTLTLLKSTSREKYRLTNRARLLSQSHTLATIHTHKPNCHTLLQSTSLRMASLLTRLL